MSLVTIFAIEIPAAVPLARAGTEISAVSVHPPINAPAGPLFLRKNSFHILRHSPRLHKIKLRVMFRFSSILIDDIVVMG